MNDLRYILMFVGGAVALYFPVSLYVNVINASRQMSLIQALLVGYCIFYTAPTVFLVAIWMQETGRGNLDNKWLVIAVIGSLLGHVYMTKLSPTSKKFGE